MITFDVRKHTVFLVVSGSHAYGTSTSKSDLDVRGVVVPPINYFQGLSSFDHLDGNSTWKYYTDLFTKVGLSWNDADVVVYDIRKFFHLVIQNNPNILDMLFVDPGLFIYIHPSFERVIQYKDRFLHKGCVERYLGYAVSQLKRMKVHRTWLFDPPKNKPDRKDFGLELMPSFSKDDVDAINTLVDKNLRDIFPDLEQLGYYNFWQSKELSSSVPERVFDTLKGGYTVESVKLILLKQILGNMYELYTNEMKYREKKKVWDNYQLWLSERNPERKALEEKYGYDLKNAKSLARLIIQCEEIIKRGTFEVNVASNLDLKKINSGELTYEMLIDWMELKRSNILSEVANSSLPDKPDFNFIESQCVAVCKEFLDSI